MNIERLLFSESSPNLGGQELQLLLQMTTLAQRGIDVRLACRPGSGIAAAAAQLGLATIATPLRMSLHPPSVVKLVRAMKAWRPDAIISHSGHDANNCALAARLLRRRPALLRVRTYLPGPPHAWTYNVLADLTLVCSQALRDELLAYPGIKPERIRVLYPGLPLARLAAEAKSPLPAHIAAWLAKHPGPLLVQAAMLRPEKGHDLLLSALPELLKKHPTLRYVIAGDGERREQLAASIQAMKLGAHVLLAGMVTPLAPLLRRATLAVMPSSYEPFGLSQCEALSLSTPVLASRVGGIPETVRHGETGLLVPPGERLAWVENIAWALDHPAEMQRMADAGRDFVAREFSIDVNVDRLLATIAAVITARNVRNERTQRSAQCDRPPP